MSFRSHAERRVRKECVVGPVGIELLTLQAVWCERVSGRRLIASARRQIGLDLGSFRSIAIRVPGPAPKEGRVSPPPPLARSRLRGRGSDGAWCAVTARRERWQRARQTRGRGRGPRAAALGDLDRASVRFLERLAAEDRSGERATVPIPSSMSLRPGCELNREWEGTVQRVRVLADGYAWKGTTYKSLSQVARAITGTRWNGPRFFGLRDRKPGERP